MKRIQKIGWVFTILAAIGLCFPVTTLAGSPSKTGPTDVKLTQKDVLVGQVLDVQGKVVAGKPVVVQYQNHLVAAPTTDKNGYFALKGVQPGVYRIASMKGVGDYRVWTEQTAPPNAASGALLVEGKEVIRGQINGMALRNVLANPIVIAGIVATAVAVPVAIHSSQDRTPSS
jgi:hypothetical protein